MAHMKGVIGLLSHPARARYRKLLTMLAMWDCALNSLSKKDTRASFVLVPSNHSLESHLNANVHVALERF